jgi:hypothetical protein
MIRKTVHKPYLSSNLPARLEQQRYLSDKVDTPPQGLGQNIEEKHEEQEGSICRHTTPNCLFVSTRIAYISTTP